MEKINSTSSSKKAKKSMNIFKFFADYFRNFGLRQFATVALLIAGIVAIVGVCLMNEACALVGFYLALGSCIVAIVDCVLTMKKIKLRKSPIYKRAIINLVIMSVVFAISLAGVIIIHVNGVAIV